MMKPVPSSYLDAAAALALLDSPPEAIFDRLTAIIVKILKVPVSTMTLIDEQRQFFKSSAGLPAHLAEARETPLTHSFCKHVVYQGEPLIVEDSRTNAVVRDNPAIQTLGVLAYAGMPVRDEDGTAIGSLCAISDRPRIWTKVELETLKLLADQASAEIALRSTALRLGQDLAQMQAAEERRHQMVRLDRHDLRTPLNALLLSVSAIPHLGPVNDEQVDCVESARKSCDAVLSILDRMLDIGNIDHQGTGALTLTDCHPDYLITTALAQVTPLADGRTIVNETDPTVLFPTIEADEGKIVRVLVNLLGNAVKFTGEKGHITIMARPRNNDGHPNIVFSVRDDGIGIAKEDQERIFEEGVHLHKDSTLRRSSGLGLTFCQRVIEIHGGRLWVESTPDKGSTFSFYLPLTLRDAAP